jgi:hypothetical protein
MEFRWLTREEQRPQAVESASLSEVLALAQKLQADSEGLVAEEQVVEMGRELGVRPEYVREALRLRRRVAQPAHNLPTEPAPTGHNPIHAAASALVITFALLMLPSVSQAFYLSNREPIWILLTFVAAAVAGWSARHPRLASLAGASAVPMILIVSSFYRYPFHHPEGVRGVAALLALVSLGPLSAAVGRAAAKARRLAERLTNRERLAIPGH